MCASVAPDAFDMSDWLSSPHHLASRVFSPCDLAANWILLRIPRVPHASCLYGKPTRGRAVER